MADNQKNNTDLDTINKAFSKVDIYKPLWLKYERYYTGKYRKEHYNKLKDLGRSKIFIPTTRNIVNIIRAIFSTSFFSQGNPIELSVKKADSNELMMNLNKVIDYYYVKLKPNKELNKAFLSALSFGIGIVTTYWDNTKEKVITSNISPTDIAFDYEANNIDDNEYICFKFFESKKSILNKIESKFYSEPDLKNKLFQNRLDDFLHIRHEVKEIIYIDDYRVKTYINGQLVRDTNFELCPFQYGYAIDKLPSIDIDRRKNEILTYGRSLIDFLIPLQDEINIKRNQKNDIQEEQINPSIIISDATKINPKDLKRGAGKRIRAEGGTDGLMFMPTPNEFALNTDLQILDKDIADASSVNSIQQGQTGASDRRSANALSMVNANSSMRTEEMITLCNETLFEHWAKTWVKLVIKNAPDDVVNLITGAEYPLGKIGERDNIDFDININFGMTIDKEKRINDLITLLQIIGQNPNINPEIIERIFKEILTIRMGDSLNVEKIFEELKQKEMIMQQNQVQQKHDLETNNIINGGV